MHWEILLIPLIALGVWILSSIFRSFEDERDKNKRGFEAGNRGRTPTARRPITDLDRFLEESRRRREAGLPKQPPTAKPVPAPPKPAPRVEREFPEAYLGRTETAKTQSQRSGQTAADPSPRTSEVRPEDPTPRRRTPETVRKPARREVTVADPVALPTLEVVLAPQAVPVGAPLTQPASQSPSRGGRGANPVLAQVAALLRDKKSVGAALVLREIFDRPLSARR
jgi:hypothetical protein